VVGVVRQREQGQSRRRRDQRRTAPAAGRGAGHGKTKLEFWLYQDTEIDEKYDLLKVFAVGTTNALWFSWQQEGMRAETWQEWVVDVSALAGKTVELYFDFDTVDKCYIGGQGVFVDDVRVERSCP
jgi:hypothetical protein